MRYIRTKNDKIVDIKDNTSIILYDNERIAIDITKRGHSCIYGIVEKVANTIEELCDEFVLISGTNQNCNPFLITITTRITGTKEVVFSDYSGHHSIIYHKKQGDEIYGVVWCEWGLKYVARMNSEGVLELL